MTQAVADALALLAPAECRLCGVRVAGSSLLPFCPTCSAPPPPILAEAHCVQCQAPFVSPSALNDEGKCRLCRANLNSFDALYAAAAYEGRMRQFIHEFKYHDMPGLDSLLVKFLAHGLPPGLEFDLVVPVPMHWWKHYLRTYNPASRLARKLARRLGFAYASPLRKVKNTAPQAQLNGRQRRRNLKDAFAVRRSARVAGKKILLVDDVFTTGTTVNSCARALKQAGAQYVAVLALARTDRRSRSGPEAALAVSQFA